MPGSDAQIKLMKRIQAKDKQALEELYHAYKSHLFGMVVSIVKSREEAEDLLQEVFVTIWQKAHTFDKSRGNVSGWVTTMARNKALDHIRSKGFKTRQKASQNVDDPGFSVESDGPDPLETTILSERAKLVKQALNKIPKFQSEVLKIACYRGMTQSEISRYLNIPLGTVKSRMRQGMIRLKGILT